MEGSVVGMPWKMPWKVLPQVVPRHAAKKDNNVHTCALTNFFHDLVSGEILSS